MPMKRYSIIDESIHFHKTNCVFHKSFEKRFKDCRTYAQVRKVAKVFHEKSQQTEIIHYLKNEDKIKIVGSLSQ